LPGCHHFLTFLSSRERIYDRVLLTLVVENHPEDLQHRGSQNDQVERWKQAEDHWKQQLDPEFSCALLCSLSAFGPRRISVGAQG
jgi:hypothetical protein